MGRRALSILPGLVGGVAVLAGLYILATVIFVGLVAAGAWTVVHLVTGRGYPAHLIWAALRDDVRERWAATR